MAKMLLKPQVSIVHMDISPVSKLTKLYSPKVFIHGIPWRVEVSKDTDGYYDSLAIYLKCEKEDKSPNWAVPACATVKLLPFSHKESILVEHIRPYVFDSSSRSFGTDLIAWNELLEGENQYVKNDAIQLKVEITAEDPNYADRSILKMETIHKCCDHGPHLTLRLTVENIENLIAVCSPRFTLRGLPWDLTVYKNQKSFLGIVLWNESTENVSCDIKMHVEVLSSDNCNVSKEKSDEVGNGNDLEISEVVSWDDLLKSKNGYVKNNAITLEVKLKADNPDGDVPDAEPSNAAVKRRRLECSICMEDLDNQDISTTTPCGHIFCTVCIKKAIKTRNVCPMCSAAVENVQRVYLPVSK